ncbi:MAG TPA: branched-chain amino acid ABC transporter permease [Beijerinckiaceae bacterium]|jgi:branched-chain amino acid transport system permease protein|nr:branched-chain amino acid ABC transporter permease [Beijerinckiaceae bacterium]
MTMVEASRSVLSLKKPPPSPLRRAVLTGLVFGIVGVYLAAVGVLLMIHGRAIIVGMLSLGQAALVTLGLGAGAFITRRESRHSFAQVVVHSLVAGAVAGALLAILVLATDAFDLRAIFIALSPDLQEMLTFGFDVPVGAAILVGAGAVFGACGAWLTHLKPAIRKPIMVGVIAVVVVGVFQELIQLILPTADWFDPVHDLIYTYDGLTPEGGLVIFVVAAGVSAFWTWYESREAAAKQIATARNLGTAVKILLALALVVVFPLVGGNYIGQVLMLVGLYILMGMGLNLEIGLAGLLDLGFVAFFAVGAYTTAILTADSPHALASYTSFPSLNYWQAMPIAVFASVMVGVMFGIPVLGVRGDYLAVATLGLGEIVRVIVQSDAAAPLLAGAQGILQIPRPSIGSFDFGDPTRLFYLTLVCAGIAAYFAWRLENSRLGRAWMAVRDDEDVAQALGINLVKVKLLAYGLGAAFAGLGGSIFAVMLTSVYPSSFQLLVSINVLALIIVGGMGSLPGVIVGALALVGLPELLREFGENRYLFYGVALIVMMRIRPEGLWPSATRRRELRAAAEGADPELEPAPSLGTVAALEAPSGE